MKLSQVRVSRRLQLATICIVAGALLIAGTVTATLSTRPVVQVTVSTRTADSSVPITVVDPSTAGASDVPGIIRAVSAEGTGTAPATGSKETSGKAHGTVKIENHWNEVQPLAATTRLLSSGGVLFRTTARADVPAGGAVSVAVEADQPGSTGNIAPDHFTVVALWPGLQDKIFGTSSTAMVGGGTSATAVAAPDILAAQHDAEKNADANAVTALSVDLPTGTVINTDSMTVASTATLSHSNVGDIAETATVTIRATVRGLVVNTEKLNVAIRAALSKEYPGEEIASLEAVPNLKTAKLPNGPFPVDVTLHLRPSHEALSAESLAGKSRTDALALLNRIPGVETAQITGLPFWARALPAANRIRVVIAPKA